MKEILALAGGCLLWILYVAIYAAIIFIVLHFVFKYW